MNDAPQDVMRQTDKMDPARAEALCATLGVAGHFKTGDPLPPFFHQIFFWTALPAEQLGRDGHPARGHGVVPDLGLPRRMWAGGRLTFERPLVAGVEATCGTTCLSVQRKSGRSGPLGLVTLGLTYRQNGDVCVREERDLIYRAEADPNAPKPTYATIDRTARHRHPLSFSTTQLFRYSALTFNGHRIHYDLDYATDVEGYAGLVVHGPLLAQNLMLLATQKLGPLRAFEFRATAPLMHFETAEACLDGTDLWVQGPDGRQCMKATATPA